MELQFDITPYIIGILVLLALFFSTWLVPLIKRKTTKEQQNIICSIADVVVFAAEKLFGAMHGEEKLAYAIGHGLDILSSHGIILDAEALRPYIEAAVQALDLRQEVADTINCTPIEGLADFLRSDDEGR